MALCLKLDEGGAEDHRVIQLCVRMNRDPEVHQVILHHLHHELLDLCSCGRKVVLPDDLRHLLRLV